MQMCKRALHFESVRDTPWLGASANECADILLLAEPLSGVADPVSCIVDEKLRHEANELSATKATRRFCCC